MFSVRPILLLLTLLGVQPISRGKFCSVKLEHGRLASKGNCDGRQRNILQDFDEKLAARETAKPASSTTTFEPLTQADGTDNTSRASGEPENSGESSGEKYFNSSLCDVIEDGICYWIHYNWSSSFNFTQAQKICATMDSVPGYFRTELAYSKTVASVRLKGRGWNTFYLGMIIDPMSDEVVHPDGEIYTKWDNDYYFYYNYTPNTTDYTHVGLFVYNYHSSSYYYYRDYDSMVTWGNGDWYLSGVVCQLNLN